MAAVQALNFMAKQTLVRACLQVSKISHAPWGFSSNVVSVGGRSILGRVLPKKQQNGRWQNAKVSIIVLSVLSCSKVMAKKLAKLLCYTL
jgi:hypothetical protein